MYFFQQWQNDQPVVIVISQVKEQKEDLLLQQKIASKGLFFCLFLNLLRCQIYKKKWLGALPET
jgi:hypothetical protein